MACRTIQNTVGDPITLSSDELDEVDLAIAEILLELSAEQGSLELRVHPDELARRLAKKGYRVDGDLIH